jgi:hypothetical protein
MSARIEGYKLRVFSLALLSDGFTDVIVHAGCSLGVPAVACSDDPTPFRTALQRYYDNDPCQQTLQFLSE